MTQSGYGDTRFGGPSLTHMRHRAKRLSEMSSAESMRTRSTWGYPSVCPVCGSTGFLDRVDLHTRIMEEHCPHCLARWEVREEDCRGSTHPH